MQYNLNLDANNTSLEKYQEMIFEIHQLNKMLDTHMTYRFKGMICEYQRKIVFEFKSMKILVTDVIKKYTNR